MALALADTITGTATATNTKAITLANVTANDIILVFFVWERQNSTPTWQSISSITEASGFTWARRSQFQISTNDGVPQHINVEVWWARASASPGSLAITVNWTGTNDPSGTDDVAVAACRITGAVASSSPWDPNASLPKKQDGSSTTGSAVTTSGVSTTNANTMVIGFFGSSSFGQPTAGAGYTQIVSFANGGGAKAASCFAEEQVFSAAQSSITVGTTVNQSRWGWVVDALTSDVGTASAVAAQTVPAFTQAATDVAIDVAAAAQTVAAFTQAATDVAIDVAAAAQTVPAFTQAAVARHAPLSMTASQTINPFAVSHPRMGNVIHGPVAAPRDSLPAGARPRRVR